MLEANSLEKYEPLKVEVEKMVGGKEPILAMFRQISNLIKDSKCKKFELKMEVKELV